MALIGWKYMIIEFLRNRLGNVGITASILALPLMLSIGIAVDYSMIFMKESKLQDAADSAALAAVKELTVPGIRNEQLQAIAKTYVRTALAGADQDGQLVVSAERLPKENSVLVSVDFYWSPMFAHLMDKSVLPITVKATATLAGEGLTCVIGFMQPQKKAKSSIHLDNNSVLRADGCSVYSNSPSRYGLRGDDKARMHAKSICSAGGVHKRGRVRFYPESITDCPVITDPLANRVAPKIRPCRETDLVINRKTSASKVTLKPGTYCGGIRIGDDVEVTLEDGIYIIKDGPLIVEDSASLTGKSASFYLTGPDSLFSFDSDTTIDLSATKSGNLAGLLFFEDRNVPHSFNFDPFKLNKLPKEVRLHKISSNNARNLLGTIYVSRSLVLVNSNAAVAQDSAYTAILAGRLWLQEGPALYLNADYTKTKVPVPDGLLGWKPTLSR